MKMEYYKNMTFICKFDYCFITNINGNINVILQTFSENIYDAVKIA